MDLHYIGQTLLNYKWIYIEWIRHDQTIKIFYIEWIGYDQIINGFTLNGSDVIKS